MNIYLGNVTKVTDELKFVVEFSIPGLLDDGVAYPIDTFDEPNVDDPIVLYQIESIFGYSFLYKKLRLTEDTRLKIKDTLIDLFEDHIEIHAGEDKSIITIDNTGKIKIDSNSSCEINSPNVTITGGTLTVDGSCAPTSSGGFCGIPVCPFTGAPHIGNKIIGT